MEYISILGAWPIYKFLYTGTRHGGLTNLTNVEGVPRPFDVRQIRHGWLRNSPRQCKAKLGLV